MKKRLTALLLCVLLILPVLPVAQASFDDISDPEVSLAATNLRGLGIVAGTSANNFTPNNSLTRAEACALIINTMDIANQVNTYKQRTVFSDVLPSAWYTGIVNLAYAKGVVNGYGNGLFGPEDKVTYGHFATMLLRLLGYTGEQIGSVWPLDYTAFCDNLELSEGLNLKPEQVLTRAQAALLLYRTLNTKPNGGKDPYYMSLSKVSSKKQVILLDNDVSYGASTGLLMVYGLEGASGVDYYDQVTPMETALNGSIVTLLLDDRGDVMAAVPESTEIRDVVIASAKGSGIVAGDGETYRINANAVTIVGDTTYNWGNNGYVQVNNRAGQSARLFYDDGVITHVCLTAGTAGTNAQVAVAETNTAAGELVRKLGISGSYSITKNGAPARAGDLARFDTAYFDKVSKTLCVSDYRLTGYIQSAQPSLDAAQSITVSGCTVPVLESAWDALENYKVGNRVTLLLTDDCKVADAVSDTEAGRELVGVLSTDGKSVTLCGSGLKVSAPDMNAEENLRGMLVQIYMDSNQISCFAYAGDKAGGQLNVANRTLGNYKLAPGCVIFEQGGSGSYLYSLAGEVGVASTDFADIYWTDTIPSNYIATVRLNSAGQVDLLVLKDVTGNCYEYGRVIRYTDQDGILTQSSPKRIYSNAAALVNGAGQSKKYLCNQILTVNVAYYGIVLKNDNTTSNQQVAATSKLTESRNISSAAFFLNGEEWYVQVDNGELPVSEKVQIYFEGTQQWLSGDEGLRAALGNGTTLDVHYDRTVSTGAQVRVIEVKEA